MRSSKAFQYVMRGLITLVGVGIGIALLFGVVQLIKIAQPEREFPVFELGISYLATSLVFGFVFFACSWRIYSWGIRIGKALIGHLDSIPMDQLLSSMICMILGLTIAFFVSRILEFMGDSVFTVAFSSIMYLALGMLGYAIGYRRSQDFVNLFPRAGYFRSRQPHRRRTAKAAAQAAPLVDASALIDGRVSDVLAAGFLTAPLAVPDFVVDELRRVADSADPQKRLRGRRGLDNLDGLIATDSAKVTAWPVEGDDADARMLRLAKGLHAPVVTVDHNLSRAAAVSGVRALNINELSNALRPTVRAGDTLTVTISKLGREPGQGIGYLPDGTMVVVQNAATHMDEALSVTVTSALQTSAGRMVFASWNQPAV